MSKKKGEEKRLQEQVAIQETKRRYVKERLLSPKAMLEGSPVARYTLCGYSDCVCHKDPKKRHGPYWYLSFQREGRSKSRYLGGDSERKKKVFAYKRYQTDLAQFRRINKLIDELLVELRDLSLERPDE